jgi:hypothetical protein
MRRILSAPLRLEFVNDIKSRFATPDVLWTTLETSANYAAGAGRLSRWSEAELLFPKSRDGEAYENLSVEGYERIAKIHLWGHTAAVLKKLDEVGRGISDVHAERPTPVFIAAMEELKFAGDRKISHKDLRFLDTVSSLISKRREMKDNRWNDCAMYGIGGIAALGAGRVMLGLITGWSGRRFASVGFALLMLLIFFLLGKLGILKDALDDIADTAENHPMSNRFPAPTSISGLVVMYFVVVMLAFPMVNLSARTTNVLGYGFPLLGAPIGTLIFNTLRKRNMERNMTDIMDACKFYVQK